MFGRSPEGTYRWIPWDAYPWLEHGFGTRHAPSDLSRFTTLRQIHSAIVLDAGAIPGCLGEGDALVTAEPGGCIGVKTADCVPVLVIDRRQRVVASVHAGWRGTVQRIAWRTARHLIEGYGSRASDLEAVIGPGIAGCCFEVGPEVAVQFTSLLPDRTDLDGRTRIDLAEVNRTQLLEAGLPASQVQGCGMCTVCQVEDFHSYRRDREHAGRMISYIGLKKENGRERWFAP